MSHRAWQSSIVHSANLLLVHYLIDRSEMHRSVVNGDAARYSSHVTPGCDRQRQRLAALCLLHLFDLIHAALPFPRQTECI